MTTNTSEIKRSSRIIPYIPSTPLPGSPRKSFFDGTSVSPTPVPDISAGVITGKALCALTLTPRKRLLGKWMREGDLGYLFAPRGAGKSWMAMMIGQAVAEGVSLGLWESGENAQRVTYLDAEMNLADVKTRASLLGLDHLHSFFFLSNELMFQKLGRGINIALPEDQEKLSKALPDGSFFIIDNLSTSQLGMGENDNDAFDSLRDWLLTLRHRAITVMIVHHAGRNGAMRGGSRREDMAHWIISLKDETEDGALNKTFSTTLTKSRNCPGYEAPPLIWSFSTQDGRVNLTCHPHESTDVMLTHIRDGVSRSTDLAELMEVGSGTVSKWARKLEAAGLIKISNRQYFPVD